MIHQIYFVFIEDVVGAALLVFMKFFKSALYVFSEDISLTFRRAATGTGGTGTSGPPAKRQKNLAQRCHGSNYLRRVVRLNGSE